MQIREREEQILRIRTTSFQPELSAALELKLRQAVVGVTKATLKSALVEELAADIRCQLHWRLDDSYKIIRSPLGI